MFLRGYLRPSLILALALPATTLVACGGSQGPKSSIDVQSGEMPEGGKWHGVYYSQTYGYLHLVEGSGDSVTGAWRTVAGDKWGEIFGQAKGDVLEYEWKEHKIGMIGPNATVEGKGYFRYIVPDDMQPHEIRGEWGLDDNNAGHTWTALKQNNMEPDPKSVRPDELESRTGAEGWDGTATEPDVTTEEPPPAQPSDEDEE